MEETEDGRDGGDGGDGGNGITQRNGETEIEQRRLGLGFSVLSSFL
jgi:hypothetical protein